MPSQADAEDALVALITSALYPSGIGAAPAIAAESRVYRGWPNASALEADLAAGIVNVSVFSAPHSGHDTTRYLSSWLPSPVVATLTVGVAGNTATFSGSAGLGQLAGVLIDGRSFVHRTVVGDTPELVAAVLCAAVASVRPASVVNSTITVPGASHMVARTAADASAALELRRQRQGFRVSVWCPTPELRDSACAILDIATAATPFLTLADGSAARLCFSSTTSSDDRQNAMLYRRDMYYTVEFPTTQVAVQPSMLFGIETLGASTIIA